MLLKFPLDSIQSDIMFTHTKYSNLRMTITRYTYLPRYPNRSKYSGKKTWKEASYLNYLDKCTIPHLEMIQLALWLGRFSFFRYGLPFCPLTRFAHLLPFFRCTQSLWRQRPRFALNFFLEEIRGALCGLWLLITGHLTLVVVVAVVAGLIAGQVGVSHSMCASISLSPLP